ncbi:MAG: hypothetical protein FWB79_03795 [Treponema sp.]|nr:hypothetical protein [Treponema sp.]
MLLNISRDEDQRARLESEYKGQLDYQSKIVQAKREGREESSMEILNLIAKGYTAEDLKREIEARR